MAKKKTLKSNAAGMNVSATHNRDRHCGRAPSPQLMSTHVHGLDGYLS